MKILIVDVLTPFIRGEKEEFAVNIQKNIIMAGHEAEVLRLPFQMEPPTCIPTQMLMARAFELSSVDRLIALQWPTYLIRHPHKTIWLLDQYRNRVETNLLPKPIGEEIQQIIKNADQQSFVESHKIFSNSEVTRKSLEDLHGCQAKILPVPINDITWQNTIQELLS